MNITFISTGQYPDTQAAAIRHSALGKGLVELGHAVNFLMLSPQDWKEKNFDYHGLQFRALNNYRGSNKILIRLYALVSVMNAKKILRRQAAEKKLDAVVIFTIDIMPVSILMRQAHSLGIKVFHERTELPYVYSTKKSVLDIYLKKLLPQFDGVFVISDKLNTYIRQFNIATKKLLTVVDLRFFSSAKPSPYNFPYIGYCGTIAGNKDGVPILIEAFAKISDRFPAIKLVLVGNNSNKTAIIETTDAISKFSLQERVIFTGIVEREMMPVILCNAEILVVAKPDNEQNSGNFPIKIGEYLATGVAVVVTKVGEIPAFIKDGESGFLAIPGDANSFAEKMEEALSDQQKAHTVGQNGRKIATSLFDYKKQAGIMADYISQTVKQQ